MSDWYQCKIIVSNSDFPSSQYRNLSFGEINGIMQESGNHSHSFIEGVVNYIDKCCNISFVSDRLGSIVIEAENESAVNNLFEKHKLKIPF